MLDINKIYCGDCLEVMTSIDDKSIDMILCDLPYGTTACKWDQIIPFEPLWKEYKRLIKDHGAIVLTASQPFTSTLVMSNPDMFKYELVWDKCLPTGFALAKIRPLKQHENILIFGNGKIAYNPQKEKRPVPRIYNRTQTGYSGSANLKSHDGKDRVLEYYEPRSLLVFSNANNKDKMHPTQKPVALFEYLIKTYTNKGDLVLDNCIGSGTTAIACINTNRNFIGIEKEQTYVNIANKRIYDIQITLNEFK